MLLAVAQHPQCAIIVACSSKYGHALRMASATVSSMLIARDALTVLGAAKPGAGPAQPYP
jgi:hypothetical protein